MNIALHAVDSKTPNYALMKISAYHRSRGDEVNWYAGLFTMNADKVYCSKIFTYSKRPSILNDQVILGGTGFDINSKLPDEIEACEPDYTLYPDFEHALGFLTRGCTRKCKDCFVPEKEGPIKPYRDIEQILQGRSSAVLMDNNILASDYGIKQLEKIAQLGIKVDFNQGLDARLINNAEARLLSKIKWLTPLRMACDSISMIKHIRKATEHLRWHNCTPTRFSVYMIVKDITDALERIRFLKGMNLDPFPQPYRDTKGTEPTQEQKDFARWVNRKWIFRSVTWDEFRCNSHKYLDYEGDE
jgi:hypothetical protein